MKPFIVHISLLFLLAYSSVFGQVSRINDADASFIKARNIAFEGEWNKAKDSLHAIVEEHPGHVEANILIAKIHSWNKNYNEARKLLNRITSNNRKAKDAWTAAIRNEIYAKNYTIAMGLANKALMYLTSDSQIEVLKDKINDEIEKQNLTFNKSKNESEKKKIKNSIAVQNSVEIFDNIFDPMLYTSLEYKKETSVGTIIPRINFSQRFDIEGLQYEIDFYPKFSKKLNGYFNYAYSNAITYPSHKAGAEIYMQLPKALEVSIGGRYLGFPNDAATIFTGSFGIYSGNYYISGRPYVTFRNDNQLGFSGNILARKYFRDRNNYLGISMGYGFNSELNQLFNNGNLLSETALFIESQNLRVEYQFSDKKGNNIYQPFLGIMRQELIFEPNSFVWSVRLGLQYQINF